MTNLSETLHALQTKYLIADGLMLRVENECIVRNLVTDINSDFDNLMAKCVELVDSAVLPGTVVEKISVKKAKLEFDVRVKDWLDDIELTKARGDIQPEAQPVLPKASFVLGDTGSTGSRRTGRSSGSSVAFKRKEGLVKMKLARYAKEKEIEKLRMTDAAERELLEADKHLQSVTRQAEAVKREAEEKANAVKREAEEKANAVKREAEERIEIARREAARLQERASRQAVLREKEWEEKLAEVEAEVWLEESGVSGLCGLSHEAKRSFKPIQESEQSKYLHFLDNEHPKPDAGTSSTEMQQSNPKTMSSSIDEQRREFELEVRPEANNRVRTAVPNGYQESGGLSRYVGGASYPAGVKSVPRPHTGFLSSGGPAGVRSVPQAQTNFLSSGGPAGAGLSSSDRNGVVHPTGLQDYPPPRPIIQTFDGDPLTYWPFIRSFEAHIARKMPCDSVKLVYLLQHCSPNIRKNLEHFSRDADLGYTLARESLFNDYGQPHVIAHCCEQKLFTAPRLKVKDAPGLKTMAILMEKCLAMLQDIQEFATLNSLGTIRRITEKLSEQMQVDWVKWSYQLFKQTGVQAKFSELVMFVRNEADEANSLYGKIFYDSFKSAKSFAGAKKTATVLSTKVESKQLVNEEELCPFCGGSHRLLQCERFQHAKRYQRVRFLARNRRCFRCLEPGHMMDKCESQQGCTVAGCTDTRHHTLLH